MSAEESTRPAASTSRPSGDRVLRFGTGLTVAGVVLTAIAILPLFFTSLTLSSAWWFAAMSATGFGLLFVLGGLWWAARQRGREARAAALVVRAKHAAERGGLEQS